VTALLANNINIDLAEVANTKQYIADRRAYLQSQLATVEVPFAVDVPPYFEADTNLIILTGTAPVGVKTILMNGVAYPMTWLSPTHFVMRFVLHAGNNTFTLQGYDRFGTNIAGATATVTAVFTGDEPNPVGAMVINEVLHTPAVPNTQFIEIVNRSTDSFDLSGWRLEGTGLVFPIGSIVLDGQTIVLARNRSAFIGAFPGVPVFNTFPTTLTATQLLMLTRTISNVVQTVDAVRFDRSAPWVVSVPGQSMQLIDAAQDNGRAANWDVSALVPVTPGASNSVAFALPPFDPIWINEIQHVSLAGLVDNFGEPSPWIEIYNAGLTPVSLTNYFLGQDFATNLTTWPFPPGATLAAGEHKVIWADGNPAQDTATDWHTSFALGRHGRLALTRLTNGMPQVVDHLAWRWLGANVTRGSHPEGQLIFRSTLVEPTPGAVNVGRPYPIMINEFMAANVNSLRDPADNEAEDWIELWNGGQHTIDLGGMYLTDSQFDPLKFRVPTNGQYRIAPGGFLLVWADDETGQNNPTRADLHVNFRLANNTGFIGLWAPDGATPVDLIAYGPQSGDVSSGRYGDGGDAGLGGNGTYYMTRPTPRNPNGLASYNSPPRPPALTNVFIAPGQALTTFVRATDPDAQLLTYTTNAASALPGSTLSQGGTYRWNVPTNQPLGEYPITVTVTDSGTPPLSDTMTFSYIVRLPGTVSTNGALGPQIHSVAAVTGGQATFTIDTTVGRTYRVFYKDELNAPLWTQLGPDFVAANPTASISDSAANPHRFYRVQQVN